MAVHGQDVVKLRDTQHLYVEHSFNAHRWETRDTGEGNEMSEYGLSMTDGPYFHVNLDQPVPLGCSSSTCSRREPLGISGTGFLWGRCPYHGHSYHTAQAVHASPVSGLDFLKRSSQREIYKHSGIG